MPKLKLSRNARQNDSEEKEMYLGGKKWKRKRKVQRNHGEIINLHLQRCNCCFPPSELLSAFIFECPVMNSLISNKYQSCQNTFDVQYVGAPRITGVNQYLSNPVITLRPSMECLCALFYSFFSLSLSLLLIKCGVTVLAGHISAWALYLERQISRLVFIKNSAWGHQVSWEPRLCLEKTFACRSPAYLQYRFRQRC